MGWEWFLALAMVAAPADTLEVTLVGNAGVMVSDGVTSLLVDLPYESGAHGYEEYAPDRLDPPGQVASVITHHHTDHFDPGLFQARPGWRVVGPKSVTGALPTARVIQGDSVRLGSFDVVAVATPHTPDHRSYRVRWRDRILYFVGDTNSARELAAGPRPDLLFITPWLACIAADEGHRDLADRTLGYHLRPGGGDRICGDIQILPQGTSLALEGRRR